MRSYPQRPDANLGANLGAHSSPLGTAPVRAKPARPERPWLSPPSPKPHPVRSRTESASPGPSEGISGLPLRWDVKAWEQFRGGVLGIPESASRQRQLECRLEKQRNP